jgi:tRNA(fMet)-specific endonuclease VapC
VLILDSNTVSDYFRGDPQGVPRLQALRPADVGVPAIVAYELQYGLMRLPLPMQRLPFDRGCAAHAARIRVDLEAAGTPIGPHDTFIAATVMRHQGTLITRNAREFARVSGLRWLSWHDAL